MTKFYVGFKTDWIEKKVCHGPTMLCGGLLV